MCATHQIRHTVDNNNRRYAGPYRARVQELTAPHFTINDVNDENNVRFAEITINFCQSRSVKVSQSYGSDSAD